MPRGKALCHYHFLAALILVICGHGSALAAQVITRVEVPSSQDRAVITIQTSDHVELELRSFSLADPSRLVFDIPDATLSPEQALCLLIGAVGVQQVRLGQLQPDPAVVRLALDLTTDRPPSWRKEYDEKSGTTLIVLGNPTAVLIKPPLVRSVEGIALVRLLGAGKLTRKTAALSDPPRIYMDLSDAILEASFKQRFLNGNISELRMAARTNIDKEGKNTSAASSEQMVRLVVELKKAEPYTVFQDGPDLVLAIGPQPWALPLPEYKPTGRLKGKQFVVDPGHGGTDIGAPVSKGALMGPVEKDLVLDIGLRLAKLLQAEGAAVTMTRKDDTFISLQERSAIANRLNADAFVSIHCNSCNIPNTLSGTMVFYDHEDSIQLAQLVQNNLIASLGTEDKRVRNANFAVIRHAQVPGILVETAFINHDGDRARLIHPNFRERTARAILEGLIAFTNPTSLPPPRTQRRGDNADKGSVE